jgi:phosphatidate phosphatase APP1
MTTLREKVASALSNARDNGYFTANTHTPREIAEDMQACDSDLEGEDIDAIERELRKVLLP